MRTLLDAASVESRTVSKDYVGTEHLVIAAIKELHSPLNIFFTNVGIGLNEIYDALSIVYKKHQSSYGNKVKDDEVIYKRPSEEELKELRQILHESDE